MKRLGFTSTQTTEIDSALEVSSDSYLTQRLKILSLYAHGMKHKDICEQAGTCRSVIESLVRRYRRGGIEAVKAMGIGKRYFTEEQIAEAKAAYEAATGGLVRRHLEVAYLYVQGKPYKDIMEATGYGQTTVIRIVQKYWDGGLNVIVSPPGASVQKRRTRYYEFTPKQVAEIRDTLKTAEKKHVARNLKALLLLADQKSLQETADATGYSLASVSQIKNEYFRQGITAITRKEHRKKQPFIAHKHKFSTAQKAEIESAYEDGAAGSRRAAMRLEVLWLRANGKSMPDISKETGYTVNAILCIIRQYMKNGLESIIKGSR